jgi:integrase/recombinase XerC
LNLLDEYAVDWELSGRSLLTLYTYRLYLKKVEAEVGLPIDLATSKRLVLKKHAEVTAATVHTFVRALKHFHRWYAEQFDEPDALAGLSYPKVSTPPPGIIASDDDVNKLFAVTQGRDFDSVRNRAILRVLADTGMRRSELVRMRLTDVDFENGFITLPDTKNGTARRVPMSQPVRKVLRTYLLARGTHCWREAPQLWIGPKGHLRSDSITQMFRRLGRRAGVNITPHTLRRRLADEWVRKGGSDDALMRIAGWKSAAMPARYRQQAADELAFEQFRRIVG